MGIKWVALICLLGALLVSPTVRAAEIHGRSSTQLLWYNNEFVDGRQFEAAEYLRVGITGVDKADKPSFYGYGRLSQDFTNGEALNGRLYCLYGEYRGLLQNPEYTGHPIRFELDTESGSNWTLNPFLTGQ